MKELTRSKGGYYRTKLGLNSIKSPEVIDLEVKPKAKKKSKSKKK